MEEKVFIVSTDGQIGITNLSFEEVSEILAAAVANKNKNNAKPIEVSEMELAESVGEFCFALLVNSSISSKIIESGLEMKEIHRKALAFAKSKGITLTQLFDNLNEMPDDDMPSQLKTIFGIDLQ